VLALIQVGILCHDLLGPFPHVTRVVFLVVIDLKDCKTISVPKLIVPSFQNVLALEGDLTVPIPAGFRV
jgi:hypothetical protein